MALVLLCRASAKAVCVRLRFISATKVAQRVRHLAPEAVEPELVPQLEPESDLAPVVHVPDGQPVHADAHDPPVVGLRRAVFREEHHAPVVVDLVVLESLCSP